MINVDMNKKIHEQITPENWTQGWFFRTKNENMVYENGKDTCSACALGWIFIRYNGGLLEYTGYDYNKMSVVQQLHQAPIYKKYSNKYGDSVAGFNDLKNRTFEDVLTMFKESDL